MGKNTKDEDRSSCQFNHGVICGWKDKCEHCGWNPTVAEERKQKIQAEREKP